MGHLGVFESRGSGGWGKRSVDEGVYIVESLL